MKSHLHDCLNTTGVRMVSVDMPKWSGTGAVSQGLHPAQRAAGNHGMLRVGERERSSFSTESTPNGYPVPSDQL